MTTWTPRRSWRSLFSLRRYFADIGRAARKRSFQQLQQLGIAAERRMLRATAGVNTHRGAIFCLGMLCAAIADCHARRMPLSATNVRRGIAYAVGRQARRTCSGEPCRQQWLACGRHACGRGARQEARWAFPAVFDTALPRLRATLACGRDWQCAQIDAFFALMAASATPMCTIAAARKAPHRQGAQWRFLAGGAPRIPTAAKAQAIHGNSLRRRLSPGGAADLLAAGLPDPRRLRRSNH